MVALASKPIDAASEVSDASKRVGMDAEEYQKWAFAAKQSGIEADKLETLMKKQQTVFADATGGNKKAAEAYKKLGIEIKGLTSGQAFEKVISSLANMSDETKRNEIANDLFGKSYADLAPLLAEGASGIDKLRQEAVDLGAVMANDTVAAGDQLGDTIDKLKGMFNGIAMQLGATLLPYIQQLADKIIENKDSIILWVTAGFDFLSAAITFVGDNLNWIIPILAATVSGFIAFKVISTITAIMTGFTAITTGASTAMGIFNAVLAANPIGLIVTLIGLAIGALVALEMKTQWVSKTFKWFIDMISGGLNLVRDFLSAAGEAANVALDNLGLGGNGNPKVTTQKSIVTKQNTSTKTVTIQNVNMYTKADKAQSLAQLDFLTGF